MHPTAHANMYTLTDVHKHVYFFTSVFDVVDKRLIFMHTHTHTNTTT